MPGTSDPPRPHLSSAVFNYLNACTWDAGQNRLENSSGNPVTCWLNQNGTPAISNPVIWECGTTTEAGSSVQAIVPNATYTVFKNGTYDSQTGLVNYSNKSYRFTFKMNGSLPGFIATQV